MEGGTGPSTINSNPAAIKAAQESMGKLDILICGQCHAVFHFVEEFQEHRSKEGACSKVSQFRESANNEQKAQVWAFLLWKESQMFSDEEKDTENSWKIYQQWCKMDSNIRKSWIVAGKTIQTFTKISTAKMTETPRQITTVTGEGGKTMIVRKVIRNGQPEEADKREGKLDKSKDGEDGIKREKIKFKLKPSIKPKVNKPDKVEGEESDEEFIVERILAKRYNPKKRCSEYLLKWEGFAHEYNTWEPAEVVGQCKELLDEFEKNLAKQKEMKAAAQVQSTVKTSTPTRVYMQKTVVKADNSVKPGPSSAAQAGRPMRSSKTKAMDQVKQWCGSMKDEENELLGKRRLDLSDSDSDAIGPKRNKFDTASDEDWTAESEEDKLGARSDMIQRAFSHATMQSNGSNRKLLSNEIVTTHGVQKVSSTPVLVADAKGVVKMDPKQMPNLTSGVYVMSRKDGIIKLDSTQPNKISVKQSQMSPNVLMVQNRETGTVVRKQVISAAQTNSTPIKVISKPDGTQVVTQMKVVQKNSNIKSQQLLIPKSEPVKIQPKPDPNQIQQIHVVTAVPSSIGLQPRMATSTIRPTARGDGRPLLPRPAIRATGQTSVLGVSSPVRSPIRPGTPRQATPQPRQVIQKRTSAGGVTTVQVSTSSPSTISQLKSKPTISTASKPLQKVASPVTTQIKVVQKTPVGKPQQSLISPQQKLLMAKRKAQEQAGITKTPNRGGLVAGQRSMVARGRGGRIAENIVAAQVNKPKESKLAQGDGLHMEFHQVGSDSSSDEETEIPPAETETVTTTVQPESPPRPFTLCPLTGRIIGPDGEPVEQAEPEPAATVSAVQSVSGQQIQAGLTESVTATTTELVLPNLDVLTDSGGIMRVEMSPGGTTGRIVQTSESGQVSLSSVTVAAPDLPCLDDTVTTTINSTATTDTIKISVGDATQSVVSTPAADAVEIKSEAKTAEEKKKMEEDGTGLVTITGDDGVVYQVAGQAEDGQALLVTRDGTQQCVYVATTDQQGEEGSVLTLDTAVAEAVAQLMPDQVGLPGQFFVKEGEGEGASNQMVMSIMDETGAEVAAAQEDGDGTAQVVAQVVQADEPTPGGTRRVVLLLPDGNFMMTEVDEEQYAALELDK